MKNAFTLSALLITSFMQAGESCESSLKSCLECTRDNTLELIPIGVCFGCVTGIIGEACRFDLADQASAVNPSGNAIEHGFEKTLEVPEQFCADWAPLMAKVLCIAPAVAHTCTLTAITCCYSKKND